MRIERVDDPTDRRLADFRDLTDVALRRVLEPAGGLYLAESRKVLGRALDAGHRPRAVLAQDKWIESIAPLLAEHDVPVYVVDEATAESVTGFAVHRGVIASMHRPEPIDPAAIIANARRVLVLDDIVDHTNVGAAFRAAAGIGVDAVLISARCADPLYRRSVRVSMGTVFQIPWTRLPAWPAAREILHAADLHIAALALADDAVPLDVFASESPDRVALVMGSEGDGLGRRALAAADSVVTIPMHGGVDSLNVAAAAAVALWELRIR